MIEIMPLQNKNDEEVKKLNLETQKENEFIIAVKDGDKLLGGGKIELCDGFAKFLSVNFFNPEDKLALEFGLGKAMLNFIERRQIYDVICEDNAHEGLLKKLRFNFCREKTLENGMQLANIFHLNLCGYFDVHC